jgi:hypothetical protein
MKVSGTPIDAPLDRGAAIAFDADEAVRIANPASRPSPHPTRCSPRIQNKTFPELRLLMESHAMDPLREFGEVCREELADLK